MPVRPLGRNNIVATLLISAAAVASIRGTPGAPFLPSGRSDGLGASFRHRRPTAKGTGVKLAATQELHAYWRAIRGARSAPERNDIDPGAIRGVLADTFILEFDPATGFPMRIVGTRTNGLFQRELRGAPFLELWRRDHRAEVGGLIETVCDEAQPFLVGAAGGPTDADVVDVEILLLPLRHHGATHSRILGLCAPRRAPEWLGLLPIGPISLISLRALREQDFRDQPPRRGGAFPALAEEERRGHLIVYTSPM
jgi:hypothetical protein